MRQLIVDPETPCQLLVDPGRREPGTDWAAFAGVAFAH